MSVGIMPNMYTTTYRSYFSPHPTSSTDGHREIAVKRNMKSVFAMETPSFSEKPQQNSDDHLSQQKNSDQIYQAQQNSDQIHLPPLNSRPNSNLNSNLNSKGSKEQVNYRSNVQRSGFWCENPVVDRTSEKFDMKTTNQELFNDPIDNYYNNSKTNKNKFKAHNSTSPYLREPILVPSQNNQDDDFFTTTTQKSFPKYETRPISIPSNVAMTSTGFQRASDGKIDVKSGESVKLAKSEIERLKFRDPIAYFNAQNNDNPYITMNQLYYQTPPRIKPF